MLNSVAQVIDDNPSVFQHFEVNKNLAKNISVAIKNKKISFV